jgi:hypothetical protein
MAVHGLAPWQAGGSLRIHVGSVLIRQVWPEDAKDLEVGSRRSGGVVAAVFIGREARFARIGRGVFACQAWHQAVGEEFDGVSPHQVAHEQSLSDEHRIEKRPIIVGHVELLEPPVDPSKDEGHATHAKAALVAGDPERRIRGRDNEVRRGWWIGRRPGTGLHGDGEERRCGEKINAFARGHSINIHA